MAKKRTFNLSGISKQTGVLYDHLRTGDLSPEEKKKVAELIKNQLLSDFKIEIETH